MLNSYYSNENIYLTTVKYYKISTNGMLCHKKPSVQQKNIPGSEKRTKSLENILKCPSETVFFFLGHRKNERKQAPKELNIKT